MKRNGGWNLENRTRRSVLRGSASIGLLGVGSSVASADGRSTHPNDAPTTVGDRVEPTERMGVGIATTSTDQTALVIKDCHPWDATANEDALAEHGVDASVSTTGTLGEHDLTAYDLIVIPSTQSEDYYEALAAQRDSLTEFVERGGVLVAHVGIAGYPCTAWEVDLFLPGGVGSHLEYYEPVSVVDPSHPMLGEFSDSDLSDWGSSTHGYLTDLPAGASVLAGLGFDPEGYPTAIEYEVGDGVVLATTQTIEWPWSPINTHGAGTKELLRAELGYAKELAGDALLDEIRERKRAKLELAESVDRNGIGFVSDRALAASALDGLLASVEDGSLDGEIVDEAIERMILGEQVTDMVLAGAGPGESEFLDSDANLSSQTAMNAVNPVLELLFAGISVLRAARAIPMVRGSADRAVNAIADFVADTAGRFSASLERLIRRRGESAGYEILGAAESEASSKGKELAEEEFKEIRDDGATLFLEDDSDVIFEDFLFNEEYDYEGYDTEPLTESLEYLISALDHTDGGPDYSGTISAAERSAKNAIEGINEICDTISTDLEEGLMTSILTRLDILVPLMTVVAFLAGVTGVLAVPGAIAAFAAGLASLTVGVLFGMAQWGKGTTAILNIRYRNQWAMRAITEPSA
ncbi:hypothetical protein [Natronorarus salvus]|uniref:hypothetical protein n=1 Tax=Natronorarus salvus TaxID=3117733 RepID=UPI002F2673FC